MNNHSCLVINPWEEWIHKQMLSGMTAWMRTVAEKVPYNSHEHIWCWNVYQKFWKLLASTQLVIYIYIHKLAKVMDSSCTLKARPPTFSLQTVYHRRNQTWYFCKWLASLCKYLDTKLGVQENILLSLKWQLQKFLENHKKKQTTEFHIYPLREYKILYQAYWHRKN